MLLILFTQNIAYVANFYKMITSILATNYSLLQVRFIGTLSSFRLWPMGYSLCSRSLWVLSRVSTPNHYSKKKGITKIKNQEKSLQRSRPLAKVRAIISLRSFSFAGFHHSHATQFEGPGRAGRGYPWSFKSSTWPKFHAKVNVSIQYQGWPKKTSN